MGNFGHFLVPELIMKGYEGLNLANIEELFINTVNWQKQNLGAISWIAQQFVIHGQGAEVENVPGLACCILQFCNFLPTGKSARMVFGRMQAWFETYKKSLFFGGRIGVLPRKTKIQISHNAMRRNVAGSIQ